MSPGPLRTLILSAGFGRGHQHANHALEDALRAALAGQGTGLSAQQVDVLTYLSGLERTLTAGTYQFWLKHTPALYRAFYRWTDREDEPRLVTDTFNWMGLRGLLRDLKRVHPHAVVSSYPTSVALTGTARRRLGGSFLNALVVTDYYVHHHWVRPEADLTMVPTEAAREQLVARGLPPEQVVVTGIPISPAYRQLAGADVLALRQRHGLRPDRPLILISGGGTGAYRALRPVLSELSALGRPVQVLVMAGAGEPGVETFGSATVHSLGYLPEFPELLAASDLVVGKAGGLTVAEATALGIPLVVYEPIPGQEEHNAEYLVRQGAARWVRHRSDLRGAVLRALDADEHAALSMASRTLGRPDAAERAARALLERIPLC